MKKISKTIAMILVLVVLAGSFTSCFTATFWRAGGVPQLLVLILIPEIMDAVTLPIQLIIWAISGEAPWDWFSASDEMETQIYLASAGHNPFTEYYSLRDKTGSLPEAQLASLKQNLYSMPETERNASIDKLTSLPEEKRVSLVRTYNSLPENEIISSLERINSLTETERISLLKTFNSLSETELDSIIEKLKSLSETENVVLADNFLSLPETNIVSLKNDFQYYNVDMRLCFQ
ncbi:MAG: hypothetical protein LBQ82_04550 [Treponema sp.]|jgi:hypothetical protein|nr:hypothetical protein [Treponema sp.]